jgi:hypothetical protein
MPQPVEINYCLIEPLSFWYVLITSLALSFLPASGGILSIGVATFLPPAGVQRKITPGHTTTGPTQAEPPLQYLSWIRASSELPCDESHDETPATKIVRHGRDMSTMAMNPNTAA